jgi:hypothetical protein
MKNFKRLIFVNLLLVIAINNKEVNVNNLDRKVGKHIIGVVIEFQSFCTLKLKL